MDKAEKEEEKDNAEARRTQRIRRAGKNERRPEAALTEEKTLIIRSGRGKGGGRRCT